MLYLRLTLFIAFAQMMCFNTIYAQENSCFTDQFLANQAEEDPEFLERLDLLDDQVRTYLQEEYVVAKSAASLTIPVVVYVVHGGGPENISDTQVLSQINVLNDYFSDYGLQFCLATTDGGTALPGATTPGIIRVNDPVLTNHNANTDQAALKSGSTLSNDRFLRIWVVNNINSGTANGYSMLPDVAPDAFDGIVMAYDAFGDIATCGCGTLDPSSQNGKILVHEVGHYLGLYHTFNGGCAGMDPTTCDTEGDRVCDTPPVAAPNSGCPGAGWNTCSETPDLPDHVNNYMDYTNESCLNSFTDGQEDRMQAMIALYRATLVSGANHVHTGIDCTGGLLAGFTASNYAPCVGTSVTFTASIVSGATYAWEFGDGVTATGAVVSHTYTSAYDPASVVLTISDGTSSVSDVQNVYVTDCSPITSTQGNWYFYDRGGVSFATGAPVYDDAAFVNNTFNVAASGVVNESSAVQSDAAGNLLFYTDGKRVWNETHTLITGSLHGNHSSMSGALIVPDPANPDMYYIFTNDVRWNSAKGFKYSKVDVSSGTAVMSGPLNVPITVPAVHGFRINPTTGAVIAGEGITAVASPNGYWILAETVKDGESKHALVYELTAAGLNFHETTFIDNLSFSIASTHVDPVNIKVSTNGKKVVFASAVWLNENDNAFDFNPCNGELSNNRLFPIEARNCSGIAFSEDPNIFYGSRAGKIYQYNLEPCEIEVIEVADIAPSTITQLQMGPDGKIYGATYGENHLVTIHEPSNLCSTVNPNACVFEATGPEMGNGTIMRSGLPNMIAATDLTVFSNEISYELAACSEVCYTYDFTGDLCATTYSWNFGDPTSGAANTSSDQNPTHTFTGPGTYTVTLVADGITTTTSVEVGVTPEIVGSLTICLEESSIGNYSIDLPVGYSIEWVTSGGTIVGLNDQSEVTIDWGLLPGSLSLTLTNDVTGCTSFASITVTESCDGPCACDLDPSFLYTVTRECVFNFSGSAGADPCMEITDYQWSFGDETFGSGENVNHVFPGPGVYEVCLTVYGTNGETLCKDEICKRIEVKCEGADCPCEIRPDFTYSVSRGCVYSFSDASIVPECQKFVEYYWNFGDGNTSIGFDAGHVYAEPGTYEVCLTVVIKDADGKSLCKEEICRKIRVTCTGDCKCELAPTFTLENNGSCNYTFTGLSGSKCTNITAFDWYVNGELASTGQVFNFDFEVNTNYTICLVVQGYSGDERCEEKVCKRFFFTDCYPIIEGKTAQGEPEVKLFPNPAQLQTTVAFDLSQDGPVRIALMSMDGKTISILEEDLRAGYQEVILPLTNQATGMMIVEVTFDNHRIMKRLIVVDK